MKVAINQVSGGSGSDVWARDLCIGLQNSGISCNLNLYHGFYQLYPDLIPLRRTISDGADLIQSHTWSGFSFKNEKPLVVTEHGVIHDPQRDLYKSFGQKIFHKRVFRFEKKSLDVADAVSSVSRFTQSEMERFFNYYDSIVIYNGIDPDFFHPQSSEQKSDDLYREKTVLLFVGNLTRMKGADLLPGIMEYLGDSFVLLATAGFRQNISISSKNIINIGILNRAELVTTYHSCDIFLTASRLEGLNLSVLEAMACGKPIVATNCCSFPEQVVEDKGGFLCEMNNCKDFAEKIQYLAENEGERKKMGNFNRDRILERFTLEQMVHGYERLYDSLLN